MKFYLLTAALVGAASMSVAEGDPAAGEKQFKRQCVSCHVVKNPDGDVLAGRNAQTGPNLYGLVNAIPGSVEGYRYSNSVMDYGKSGAVWNEDTTVAYLQDPSGFLKAALNDKAARARMSFRVRKEQDAKDIFAYLSQFGAQ